MTPTVNVKTVFRNMLIGALVGLAVISFFIFPVDSPNPEWGANWRVKPLIITPLTTAFASLVFFTKDLLQPKTTALKAVIMVLSTLAFFIALWLGIVLGLDGTLWN